jgi:oligoribonuclease
MMAVARADCSAQVDEPCGAYDGPMLVWMDLEMTGLDHTSDVIVEIATLITDDDLNIVAEGPDLVVHQPDDVLARMDPFVVEMHTKSGLLDQIKQSTVTLQDAGAATLEFIKHHVPEPGCVPLCGISIGTDRRFLAAYLPEIEDHLHYRSIDVSSIKELAKRWYPEVAAGRTKGEGSHRALDDIRESVRELAYYREHVFVPAPPPVEPTAEPSSEGSSGPSSEGPAAAPDRPLG